MYAVCSAISIFINVGSISGHSVKSTNGAFLLIHAPILSELACQILNNNNNNSYAISRTSVYNSDVVAQLQGGGRSAMGLAD